jgi:peroxiredoxin
MNTHPLLGQMAPTFAVDTLEDGSATLADAAGSVLVVDFWASWCPPCVEGLPVLRDAVQSFADADVPVRLIAMNVQEDPATIRQFLDEQGLTDLTVGLDPDGTVAQAYGVQGIPQTVVINPDGRVSAVHVGFHDGTAAKLQEDIEQAIGGGA